MKKESKDHILEVKCVVTVEWDTIGGGKRSDSLQHCGLDFIDKMREFIDEIEADLFNKKDTLTFDGGVPPLDDTWEKWYAEKMRREAGVMIFGTGIGE